MCDEVGAEGTPHTHLYIYSPNAILFSTLQQRFFGAHIEIARGRHQENRDYIRKEGKWLDDAKHETNLPDTFEESGAVPSERDRRETISEEILEMILAGASNAEILMQHPGAMNRLHHIEAARQTLFADKYADAWRDLDVTYLWGKTGVGKTRTIMERYGYKNVYRVTDYDHPFDDYKGEKVVLFEEFRSSLKIADMLKYLDGYPLMLPCRYGNKAAGFDKVYIVSNIPLSQQYPNTQLSEQETYKAFLRRIDREYEMLESFDGGLGLALLHHAQHRVQQHHDEDDEHLREALAAEGVGHGGHRRRCQQDQQHGILQLGQKALEQGGLFRLLQFVGAVFGQPLRRLLLRQAGGTGAQLLQNLLRAAVVIIVHVYRSLLSEIMRLRAKKKTHARTGYVGA